MGKQWNSGCKRCGNEFGYSDRSYKNDLKIGHSRPEYCEKCRENESKTRTEMGISYVSAKPNNGIVCTGFGELNHPGRNHQLIEKEGSIDESKFGITPDKIVEIANWFQNPVHRVVVVVGPTGSGKSTALPAWLMDPSLVTDLPSDYFTREGQIIHTQPRIIAAEGQTRFVGNTLMGVDVGAGFDIGLDYSQHNSSDRRNLWVSVTDGKFVNFIIKGKLGNYGYIIIDEAHERSINIDLILNLLKDRLSLFPKIKIIIASATIDAQKFQDFFGSEVAGIIEFEGKERQDQNGNLLIHTEFYQDEETILPYNDLPKLAKSIVSLVVQKALWIASEIIAGRKNQGDILVFLPGKGPISRAIDLTRSLINNNNDMLNIVEVYPLYRDLTVDEKDKINDHNLADGKIWIIYSTNIAEASVTIDSLGYEVETGLENQSVFDFHTNTTTVPLNLISRANARQRWGRTGRTRNGEVYCLYTESQFNDLNLFRDYPVSAIQRSSMEEPLLVMKYAGVSDPTSGWLENPDSSESDRSLDVLYKSGVITKDGSLSKKGILRSSFSYPAKLVDALFIADDLGVIVEFASILPVIINGGSRRLLNWNFNWDGYQKLDASNKHRALMVGCRDDVEFILKIIKLWIELLWIDPVSLVEKTSEEKNQLRQDWAQRNFINVKEVETIIQQREEILNHFFENNKNEDFPNIDFILMSRLRGFLFNTFPETQKRDLQIPYEFDPFLKPQEGSIITCNCLAPEIATENNTLSRIFIDQIYTINSRFFAIPLSESGSEIKRTSNILNSVVYAEVETLFENETEEEIIEDKNTKEKRLKILSNEILTNYNLINVQITCYENLFIDPTVMELEVVGYEFVNTPTVIVRPVVKPEPFDEFVRLKKIGNNIQVEVLNTFSFPHDNHPILLVKEYLSQMEILMIAEEITFSNSPSVVTKIPIGTILEVRIEKIVRQARRVYLSMLGQSEQMINELFALENNKGNKNDAISVRVADIRFDGVNFLLGWVNYQKGFIPISFVREEKLPKDREKYQPEEEYHVFVSRGTDSKHPIKVSISEIPKLLEVQLNNKQAPEGLDYHRPYLEFIGRMGGNIRYYLKNIDTNKEYQSVVDRLYWLSNRININRFLDTDWYQNAQVKFPINTQLQAVVKTVVPQSGLALEIDNQFRAFMPRSLVLTDFRANLSHSFQENMVIFAQVVEIRVSSKELILQQISALEKVLEPKLDPDPELELMVSIVNRLSNPIPTISVVKPEEGLWSKFIRWLNT